jgi:hypothetical protein
MKRSIILIIGICLITYNTVQSQNFLLRTSDYIDNPKEFLDNFVEIARQGTSYSEKLIIEKYGEDIEIRKDNNPPFIMVLFSHKFEPRFPLLRATSREDNATVFTTKMRVPPRIDIKTYLRELGFVYVNEKQEDGFYTTVFNGSGSGNIIVELAYFDLVIQIMEFPYNEVYIQTSLFVEDRN